MSFGDPPAAATPATQSQTTTDGLAVVLGLIVPAVTILGLIVLLALKAIDQAAGLGLIGALAGVHGGALVATQAGK